MGSQPAGSTPLIGSAGFLMQSLSPIAVARWIVVLALLAMAYFYFDYALISASQTAALSGYEQSEVWSYAAFESFGRGTALVFAAILAGFNIRSGWPRLRSRWNLFLVGALLIALFVPPAWRLMEIDSCLDSGAAWVYEYERCSSGT